MTDTIACPTCGAEVPAVAAFCTSCGEQLTASGSPPAPDGATPPPGVPTGPDATAVTTPGLHDPTQVVAPAAAPPPPPPPAAPPAPFGTQAPLGPPPGQAPWAAGTSVAPDGPPTTAPWNPPSAPAPPNWQQPVPPPEAQAWAGPGGMAPATVYGTAAVPTGAAAAGGGRSVIGGILGILGGVLALVGVFSGWVELGDTGTVSGWSLTSGDGLLESSDPYLIVGLGAAAIVGGILLFTGVARTLVRVAMVLLGIGIVAVAALNWLSIADFVESNLPSSFEASTAIGFYLAIAGGVVAALSALAPASKS